MSRSRFGLAAILYALLTAYASTMVGPVGVNFVPIPAHEALARFLAMSFVAHGSDQRADWMGNLLIMVPLGFLMAGWLSPARRASVVGLIGALATTLSWVLAVKFLQLFFPPRTVTLNYVMAQSLGAVAGIVLFGALRSPPGALGRDLGRVESLRLALRLYTACVVLFMLMPLDFAVSLDDFVAQLDRLPDTFTAITGEGRPAVVRLVLILTSTAAMIPVGALLTFMGEGRVYVGRPAGAAAWMGFCGMTAVYGLSALVLSGGPSLLAIGYRTAGIAAGAWLMHWLTRQNMDTIRHHLARLVPWAVPVYLLTLAAVNGLLSLDWITPERAAEDLYPRGLIPLFNYYIVAKGQAAKNIVGHAAMYVPIGVMIWSRAKPGAGGAAAFGLAAVLSALVETGRFLRPGLVPDINAVPLAGVSAWVVWALMPEVWRMIGSVTLGGLTPRPLDREGEAAEIPGWRDRAADRRARRRNRGKVLGDVEDY